MNTFHQEDEIIRNPNREKKEYAQTPYVPEHIRLGRNPISQDFSSLDGEILETDFVDSHILDNNENVNYQIGHTKKTVNTESSSPEVGDFVLMVSGKVISHGDRNIILAESKSILYGEHPLFMNNSIKLEDIIILKRVTLKVGVFLDE